jgi:murein DD-endopeptidase MepM/ murein hydrolase activator NlpD
MEICAIQNIENVKRELRKQPITAEEYGAINRNLDRELRWSLLFTSRIRIILLAILAFGVVCGAFFGIREWYDVRGTKYKNEINSGKVALEETYTRQIIEKQAEIESLQSAVVKQQTIINDGIKKLEEKYNIINARFPGALDREFIDLLEGGQGSATFVEAESIEDILGKIEEAPAELLTLIAETHPEYVGAANYDRLLEQQGVLNYVPVHGFDLPLEDLENSFVTSEHTVRDWKKKFGDQLIVVGQDLHQGIDIRNLKNTNLTFPYDGTVVYAENYHLSDRYKNDPLRKRGTGVIFQPDPAALRADGIDEPIVYYRLWHLDENLPPYVYSGAKVKKGWKLGNIGSTGLSSAPHLHLEIMTPADSNHLSGEWEFLVYSETDIITDDAVYINTALENFLSDFR